MTSWTTTLAVGSRLRYEGEAHTVIAIGGSHVTLRSQQGRTWAADLRRVLAHGAALSPSGELTPQDALGQLVDNLSDAEGRRLAERVGHVREVLTGFRSGSAELADEGEPRPAYRCDHPVLERQQAKADEVGVGLRTVQRWLAAYAVDGPAGLIDSRHHRELDPLRGVDQRWLDTCRTVLDEHVDASRPTKKLILERVEARLAEAHGGGVVPIPHRKRAHAAMAELTRGSNAFGGATKQKRSIARRPEGAYGRLRPTRPGEYLLLDTTPLDVFAMEPLTLRLGLRELTIALDLYTRCIAGLRLSPVSTKAVDAALVLYESITPDTAASTGTGLLPYQGVPSVVVVDGDRVAGPGLPDVDPETLVLDHGRIYLSAHVLSVCARLGISIQPARPYTPTDKAAVERFFRTLGEGLLEALPGYKGPDVYSRGDAVEDKAFYLLPELEQVIREWVATVYHRRPHGGLVDPTVPGLELSPLDMFEHGVARAGRLRVPARRGLVYDFLPVAWRTIQHYGIEVNGLRYNGEGLSPYRNARSPTGALTQGSGRSATTPTTSPRCSSRTPKTSSGTRWCGSTRPRSRCRSVPRPWRTPAASPSRPTASPTTVGCWPSCWRAGTRGWPPTRPSGGWRCGSPNSAPPASAPQPAPSPTPVKGLATVRALFGDDPPPSAQGPVAGDDDDPDEIDADVAGDAEHYYDDAFPVIR